MNSEELDKQITSWVNRKSTNPTDVAVEVAIGQFLLIYNIDKNVSLIRDILDKRLK